MYDFLLLGKIPYDSCFIFQKHSFLYYLRPRFPFSIVYTLVTAEHIPPMNTASKSEITTKEDVAQNISNVRKDSYKIKLDLN